MHLQRCVCSQALPFLEGTFHRLAQHVLAQHLQGPEEETQPHGSPTSVPDCARGAGVWCRSRAQIWREHLLMVSLSLTCSPVHLSPKGLDEEGQGETLLGSFIYSMQKEPTQTFPLQVQWVRVGRRPGQKHQFASKWLAGGEWTVPGRTGA